MKTNETEATQQTNMKRYFSGGGMTSKHITPSQVVEWVKQQDANNDGPHYQVGYLSAVIAEIINEGTGRLGFLRRHYRAAILRANSRETNTVQPGKTTNDHP